MQSILAELPVGIYKVRYRVGNSVADKLVELPEGQGAHTPSDLPTIPIVSPVPLSGPGTHVQSPTSGLASNWSTTVHLSNGSGSRVFLFVDAPTDPTQSPILPGAVTLLTFDGVQIASLAQGSSDQGCFGFTVAPGEVATDVDWDLLKQIAGSDAPRISQTDLNPVERAVMSYVTMGAKRYSLISKVTPTLTPDPEAAKEMTPETITAATGIPYSVILDAAASLTKRLK